jgi:hypothetical protein
MLFRPRDRHAREMANFLLFSHVIEAAGYLRRQGEISRGSVRHVVELAQAEPKFCTSNAHRCHMVPQKRLHGNISKHQIQFCDPRPPGPATRGFSNPKDLSPSVVTALSHPVPYSINACDSTCRNAMGWDSKLRPEPETYVDGVLKLLSSTIHRSLLDCAQERRR